MTRDELVARVAEAMEQGKSPSDIVEIMDVATAEDVAKLTKERDDKRQEVIGLRRLLESQQDGSLRIKPFMSSGIPFLRVDRRTIDGFPLQIVAMSTGMTMIRIGPNALFFTPEGDFDGNECKPSGIEPGSRTAQSIMAAFAASHENDGQAPAEPYFLPGSNGYEDETRPWPKPSAAKDKN